MRNGGYLLAVHPWSRGFGWIVFEGTSPFDWGTAFIADGNNKNTVVALERLLGKYAPCVFVLEAFEDAASRRRQRIRLLCRLFVGRAQQRDIAVHVYGRNEIGSALNGARTRQAVALAVADRLPELRPRVPKPQKIWVGEHSAAALFCAAACALTHQRARV
jgi:hypothetical protein